MLIFSVFYLCCCFLTAPPPRPLHSLFSLFQCVTMIMLFIIMIIQNKISSLPVCLEQKRRRNTYETKKKNFFFLNIHLMCIIKKEIHVIFSSFFIPLFILVDFVGYIPSTHMHSFCIIIIIQLV